MLQNLILRCCYDYYGWLHGQTKIRTRSGSFVHLSTPFQDSPMGRCCFMKLQDASCFRAKLPLFKWFSRCFRLIPLLSFATVATFVPGPLYFVIFLFLSLLFCPLQTLPRLLSKTVFLLFLITKVVQVILNLSHPV